jgi:hypothetical protein
MNDALLFRLSAVATLIAATYAGYRWFKGREQSGVTAQLADLRTTTQAQAAFVIPSQNATDPGFSNYSRRMDLFAPLDIADQPLAYGQSIPQ